jgi:diguanylate cyclase (GGDEF)-like protein
MTVKILIAGAQHHDQHSVLEKTVSNLNAEILRATDTDEIQRLCHGHAFALLIIDESLSPTGKRLHVPPLSPTTTTLFIVSSAQELSTPGTGEQGEYIDYISQPLTPSLLLGKIHTLLHIHHLQQKLISCNNALLDQQDKNHQWQRSLGQQNYYLNMLSVRDGLTGLFNRRHLIQMLEQELYKAKNQDTDLALLLLDIDYFNETNRTSGQVFGDSILNEFAARLTQNSRESDICFRFGGSDFVVLLPETAITEAWEQAEKLRLTCSEKPFTSGPHSRFVTVSIGMVTLLAHNPKNQDEFITMADQAMYQAKSEGRNRVIIYGQNNAVTDGKIDTITLMQETLHRILEKTKNSSIASIQILAQNVTGKSQDEHAHLATQYTHQLCKHLGLPKAMLETFANALTLYSCFRLLLHRELLAKKEKFSHDDRTLVNDLPYKLAELTRHFDYFANERTMLLCQGERYDGSGYPEGLAGEEIPLAARIFSLADALAAMNADRPHRKRLTPSQILKQLMQGAGTQWDPALVLLTLDILHAQQLLPIDEDQLTQAKLLVSQKIAQSSDPTW